MLRVVTHCVLVFSIVLANAASAQQFSRFYGFGDSNIDTGWFRKSSTGSAAFDTAIANGLAAGAGGKFTEGTGRLSSEVLAGYFGLRADPANQPGGTSFATGGARTALANSAGEGFFLGAVSMTDQIKSYLAAGGGRADSNGLYLVAIGANDVAFAADQTRSTANFPIFAPGSAAATTYLRDQARAGVAAIASLRAAGARYIVVPNEPQSFGNATVQQYRAVYDNTLWFGLAQAGVNFVPADVNAIRLAIAANPSAFGFQFIGTGSPACTPGASPLNTAFSLFCSPGRLVSPDAGQTHLFADDSHLTSAGQKILGDYYYSLVIAPSQISMIAESAVRSRSGTVATIQRQIEVTHINQGSGKLNAWVSGDVGSLKLDGTSGFPGDSAIPVSLAGGVSYILAPGVLIGSAITIGQSRAEWGLDRGSFVQDEVAGSIYAAMRGNGVWGNVVGTYGALRYDINRAVPLGIAVLANHGEAHGTNRSLGAQLGYDFTLGNLKTGPLAGLLWQRATIDGFVESGGATSLGFLDQTRHSAIAQLGWRARLDLGVWQPFAQVAWNRELANTERNVTAFLTSISAPSYFMPAVAAEKNWGTASFGTTLKLAEGMLALGVVQTDFSETGARSYGGQLGLNVRF